MSEEVVQKSNELKETQVEIEAIHQKVGVQIESAVQNLVEPLQIKYKAQEASWDIFHDNSYLGKIEKALMETRGVWKN